jgi:Tol biopolymer transport system component
VSGDGRTLAYFRKKDNRLVARTPGGRVVAMPQKALPRGLGMAELELSLSQDGRYLAVDYYDDGERLPTRIYDVSAARETGTVPGAASFQGFSGSGDAVLLSRVTDENTTELTTFDVQGSPRYTVVPPQVVSNNTPYGLSPDGRRIALFTGTAAKPVLKLYDLQSDRIDDSTPVNLGGKDLPYMVDWTGDTEVTAHISRTRGNGHTSMRVVQIDTVSGAVTVRDSYDVLRDSYAFAACGG